MDSLTRTKFLLVPSPIRDWFGSDECLEAIDATTVHFHIAKEKEGVLGQLILKLEIKELAPEYFAGELSAKLGLDKDKARSFAEEIQKNVLGPVKNEFAAIDIDIDRLSEFNLPAVAPTSSITAGPKMMSSVSPLGTVSSLPNRIATGSGMPGSPMAAPISISGMPTATQGKFAPFIPAKPQSPSSLSQAGWSKPGAQAAMPSAAMPTAGAMPVTVAPAGGEPAPVMLHQDAKFSASDKTTDFHLTRPGGGAEVSLDGVSSQQKIKPAVLELGSLGTPGLQSGAPKFVHYSQFDSNVSGQPAATSSTQAPRNVTEVVSRPAPATPVVSAPIMPTGPAPISSLPTTGLKINPLSPKPDAARMTIPTTPATPVRPAVVVASPLPASSGPVIKPIAPIAPIPAVKPISAMPAAAPVKPLSGMVPLPPPPRPPAPPPSAQQKPGIPPVQKNYP